MVVGQIIQHTDHVQQRKCYLNPVENVFRQNVRSFSEDLRATNASQKQLVRLEGVWGEGVGVWGRDGVSHPHPSHTLTRTYFLSSIKVAKYSFFYIILILEKSIFWRKCVLRRK